MVIKNDLTTVEKKVRRKGGREGGREKKKMNLIKHGPSLANLC